MRLIYPLLWSRPDRKACREQSVNTAAALARLGVEVTLMLPRRASDPEIGADQLRDYFQVEGDFQLVQRESRWVGDSALASSMWMRQLFKEPGLERFDLIFSRIPAMIAAGGFSPLPFATDHYKPWPDALPVIRPLIRRTARHRRCLGFVLHSQFAASSYERIGVPSAKLLVAHNGANIDASRPRLSKREARSLLSLPMERPIAVYAGRINAHKGLDQLLALARLRTDVLFLLVGSEGHGPIEAEAAGIENVLVSPWQLPAQLPAYLSAADLLIIPPSSAPLEQFGNCVLPLKTFSYLAAGRPILGPALPDTAELLRDGDNAVLVPADDPQQAAQAIDRILGDSDFAVSLGSAAAETAKGLSWDSRAARIAAFLEQQLAALR